MLQELLIKNLALIDQLSIVFHPGLNVLTGETGAGKTIIISALELVLGGRASSEYIRSGEEKATLEACFDIAGLDNIERLMSDYGIDSQEGTLILKRQLSRNGKSSCYANGSLITLNCMAQIGQELIDFHGQHQHQLLLRPDTHIDFLDAFGKLSDLRQECGEIFNTWQAKQNDLFCLARENQQRQQKRQLLEFQLQEIDDLQLEDKEQAALLQERAILQNVGKLMEHGHFIYDATYDADDSVRDRLAEVRERLLEMGRVDVNLAAYAESLESVQIQLDDIAFALKSYIERLEYDPDRQQAIENRLAQIEKLEQKYCRGAAGLSAYREKIDAELKLLAEQDTQITSQLREVNLLNQKLNSLSVELSAKRKGVIGKIDCLMSKELAQLGMEKAKFETRLSPTDKPSNPRILPCELATYDSTPAYLGNARGIDQVEFLFCANQGEECKPLARIASGGELSRIMLALKSLLAERDRVPTLIFDEVDAGVGGRIAEVIGKKLKSLAANHQILCITHLPQIASFADYHYTVEKTTIQGRTVTCIKELDKSAKVTEIARLLTGEKITPLAMEHAREMMDKG
jgi:DNA repair protein RecN (Recombination protein N)